MSVVYSVINYFTSWYGSSDNPERNGRNLPSEIEAILKKNWKEEINITLRLDSVSEEKKTIIEKRGIRIIGDLSPVEESVSVRGTGEAICNLFYALPFIVSLRIPKTLDLQ
jgi:hypothetical protein